jgi:coenzyme F420-0:L-glutamate ligase/coenzyme F420-1:gamma-L-glutamate ligase
MNVLEIPSPATSAKPVTAQLIALDGVPLVSAGDDLAAVVVGALEASGEMLRDGDIVVIAQKIVSKAEGRAVKLTSVVPSADALDVAEETNKDPRLVELILRETAEIVRRRRDVLIVAHRLGFVSANAGVDRSNVDGEDSALLLPEDPDQTCAELRQALKASTGADVAVIINDSHGRAFRKGTVGVAIGASGLPALDDRRGDLDLYRRPLKITEVALADELASAASLLMGQAGEGRPVVLVRGVAVKRREGMAADLVRPRVMDLFRPPAADDLFRHRRSVRRYSSKPVSENLLDDILALAVCAPSAHDRQPWRFAILKDAATKSRLALGMAERLRSDRSRDGDAAELIEKDVAKSIARITAAPLAIVVSLTMEDMDCYPDTGRAAKEHQMAVQGTAMAMQNILLAAHARGLGGSIMCAPLFCPDTVQRILNLPHRWEPQALLTLGYPTKTAPATQRRPLKDVVRIVQAKS